MSAANLNDVGRMQTLLILAYYFAPAAVVGTNRTLRFAKHLPYFGWNTIIVTVKENYYDLCQPSLNEKVGENCIIYRTSIWGSRKAKRLYEPSEHGGILETGVQFDGAHSTLSKIIKYYTTIPDTKNGWLPFAVIESLKAIRKHKIDAILTTSYPYTAHLAGLILKKLTGKRWIADFRDPWAEYAFLHPDSTFHRKMAAFLESKIIKVADLIIANTSAARDRFQKRYPQYSTKITSIPNGFESAEFQIQCNEPKSSAFVITHTGTIYPEKSRRDPFTFLSAVAQFIDRNPQMRDRLQVRFIGHTHFKISPTEIADMLGIGSNVISVGYVSHQECVRELLEADLLLLIHHADKPIGRLYSTIPAKTYEYLAAQKPILCLSSYGIIKDLISEMHVGLSVDPIDQNAICEAIENIYKNYESWQTTIASNSQLQQYEARTLTGQLALLLQNNSDQSIPVDKFPASIRKRSDLCQ